MSKPIAQYLRDIDAVNGCEVGEARDALENYIALQGDKAPTAILQCILMQLWTATDKIERLCSEVDHAAQ